MPTASRSLHLLLLLCAVGLGFFLGRQSSPSPSSHSTAIQLSALNAPASANNILAPAPDSTASSNVASTSADTLLQHASSPATEQALCSQLQKLATTDPLAALNFAQTAATPRQRELLRNAALQGWATCDPMAACDWVLAHIRSDDRRVAVEAITIGAVARPEEAIRALKHLIQTDPQLACENGNTLVTELARTGRFDLASTFAADGPLEYRSAWLATAFYRWAQYQPTVALDAINTLPDATVRHDAFQGLISGWAASDPAALVNYAQTLPIGEARLDALKNGLEQWVHLDASAASSWMDNYNPSPDLDAGAAAIATAPALVAKKPDVATSWAESITDPELRANTLLDLIRLWGTHDVESARRYASTSTALRPETRELALSSLQSPP